MQQLANDRHFTSASQTPKIADGVWRAAAGFAAPSPPILPLQAASVAPCGAPAPAPGCPRPCIRRCPLPQCWLLLLLLQLKVRRRSARLLKHPSRTCNAFYESCKQTSKPRGCKKPCRLPHVPSGAKTCSQGYDRRQTQTRTPRLVWHVSPTSYAMPYHPQPWSPL